MNTVNSAVIVKVNSRGRLLLVRTVGDFTGDAIHGVLADLERGGGDVVPGSIWQVPVVEDHGDPDVGLPPLGWVLDWEGAEVFTGRMDLEDIEGPELPPCWPDMTERVLRELAQL